MERLLYNKPLWKTFEDKAGHDEVALVDKLTQKAAQQLDYIRDTFPTYTLHNETHILNVVDLMGELLGERIDDLTALEATILILSAYYHDIGMAFSEDERNKILNEPEFEDFLKKYPSAQIQLIEYQKKYPNEISEDLAEWYCRWIHPTRSAFIIMDSDKIDWKGHPINNALAAVCKSHGDPIQVLLNDQNISNSFLGDTDLVFCALILRLADILDFDNTRSPDKVYKLLGLNKRESKRKERSDIEWLKHLSSGGFKFNHREKENRYILNFSAAPTEPAVEYDVREFLRIIEFEIEQCDYALKRVSNKWQTFKLPQNINKNNITSYGYTYGEFKFTLEQDQIMNLLMGENLYDDKYVFIRELTQNAIDTTRHRIAYEKSIGNTSYQPQPITFTSWTDNDGYTWIRIDDYGMGMDEEILVNYFLKVGQSYYQSDQFKLDSIQLVEKNIDFVPISRFGIGILSCFIVGDKIEVSTRRITDRSERNALRIKIENFQEFFILNKESEWHEVSPMPNENSIEEKYREYKKYGTSIAVRINPKSDIGYFVLEETLKQYISCTTVPIQYKDEQINWDYEKTISKHWIQSSVYEVDKQTQEQIEEFIQEEFSEPIKIIVEPIGLTQHSISNRLVGQGLVCYVTTPESTPTNTAKDFVFKGISLTTSSFYSSNQEMLFSISVNCILNDQKHGALSKELGIYVNREKSENFPLNIKELNSLLNQYYYNKLSHNGIKINAYRNLNDNGILDHMEFKKHGDTITISHVALQDSLRPQLSISRDEIKNMPWEYYCELGITLRRALAGTDFYKNSTNNKFTDTFPSINKISYSEFENNNIITEWAKEDIFTIKNKRINIDKVTQENINNILSTIYTTIYFVGRNQHFEDFIIKFLIQQKFNFQLDADTQEFIVLNNTKPILTENIKQYPPLFFIQYSNPDIFIISSFPPNSSHPLSKWLIENTFTLKKKHPAIFYNLLEAFALAETVDSNLYREEGIKTINIILDRIMSLKFENKPPKSAYLNEDSIRLS